MFEDATKDIMIAKALVAGARECRVIRDPVLYTKATEPAIGEVDLTSRQSARSERIANT